MPSARPARSWAPPAAGGGGAATCRLARRSAGLAGRRALTIVTRRVRRQRSVSLPGPEPSRALAAVARSPHAHGVPIPRLLRHLCGGHLRSVAGRRAAEPLPAGQVGVCTWPSPLSALSPASVFAAVDRLLAAAPGAAGLAATATAPLRRPDGPARPQRPWPTVSGTHRHCAQPMPHLSPAACRRQPPPPPALAAAHQQARHTRSRLLQTSRACPACARGAAPPPTWRARGWPWSIQPSWPSLRRRAASRGPLAWGCRACPPLRRSKCRFTCSTSRRCRWRRGVHPAPAACR